MKRTLSLLLAAIILIAGIAAISSAAELPQGQTAAPSPDSPDESLQLHAV